MIIYRAIMRLAAIIPGALVLGCASLPDQHPPETQIVSRVISAPAQLIPVPVPCLDPAKVPPPPSVVIDPKAPVLQRYYQLRAALDELDAYRIQVAPLLANCLANAPTPKETTK